MSSPAYAAPLLLRPGRSGRLLLLSSGAYAGAFAVLFAAPIPPLAAIGASLWLTFWAGRTYWKYFGPSRIVEAVWEESGEWRIRQSSGREVTARLASDTFFHPRMVVLNFRARAVPALVLFGGEPDPRTHRRLRVRLRLYQGVVDEAEEEGWREHLSRLLRRRRSWPE